MVSQNPWFEDFQKNLSELLAKTPAAELERSIKSLMMQAFSRMDLITREEFDAQAEVLQRTLERVEQLESRLDATAGASGTPEKPAP